MSPTDDGSAHIPPPPAHYPVPQTPQPSQDQNPAEGTVAMGQESQPAVAPSVEAIDPSMVAELTHAPTEMSESANHSIGLEETTPTQAPDSATMPQPSEPVLYAADQQHVLDPEGHADQPFTQVEPTSDPFIAPQPAADSMPAPKPADKFDHDLHTFVPDTPVQSAPDPIPHDAPREIKHPLDEEPQPVVADTNIATQAPAMNSETLSFEELKVDPVPKSPIPSVLPPNPLDSSEDAPLPTNTSFHDESVGQVAPVEKVIFSAPKAQNKMIVPFTVAIVSFGLLMLISIPFVLNQGASTPKTENKTPQVTTITNLPSGYVSVDRQCYSVALPKDNTIALDSSCVVAGNFGPKSESNISILPVTKTYASSDSFYQEATKAPNELKVISKSSIKLDGLQAIKVIHNVGSGNTVQKQMNVYVSTSTKDYRVGESKIGGFEIVMSYNDSYSAQVAEQVLNRWKWH